MPRKSTSRNIAKRILIGLLVLIVLLLMLAVAGFVWLKNEASANLTPPPNPPNQRSISSYVLESLPQSTTEVSAPVAPLSAFSWESIDNPPKSSRPWTRWWWPGGAVEASVLLEQMTGLDAAGFGGAEIQPFAMGLQAVDDADELARVYTFDTPDYYQTLKAVFEHAVALGWQVDLTHFSGWPPGGPQVNLEDSLTELVYSETAITGGEALSLRLPEPEAGPGKLLFSIAEGAMGDFINFPGNRATLLSVIAARTTSGAHSRNPFNLGDTVTLDADSVQVLTSNVEDGVLAWNAPPGDWKIISSYLMPSGEVPISGAQKPRGFVVDHLRRLHVLGHYEYAFGARTGLSDYYGKGFRGFFNDSLEFRLNRMAVEDILGQFRTRRGYELEPYLPVVYTEGADNMYFTEVLGIHAPPEFRLTEDDERIRYDYQLTLSDLIIERFVETSADWAQSHGLTSRAQSYGMDIDILRALGANTIPETEQLWAGGSDLVLKMASSAAALYGKPLASAESFVWEGRDFTTTARKIKAAADKLFLAGINHIIYHGTPYPWRGGDAEPFGPEGWTPFSGPKNQAHFSSIVAAGNTQLWPDIAPVNRYISRSQNLLRQGSPDIDVLIYYPFLGFDGRRDKANERDETLLNGSIPDADPRAMTPDPLGAVEPYTDALFNLPAGHKSAREDWTARVIPLTQELDRRGITWAWVNEHTITSGKVGAGTLTASNGRFGAMLLPDVKMIEPTALRRLIDLSARDVPVYFSGGLPMQQPGFLHAAQGDRDVASLVQQALTGGAKQLPEEVGALAAALQRALVQPVSYRNASTIKTLRRSLDDHQMIHFFANQSADTAMLELEAQLPADAWWFDALQGVAWPAQDADEKLALQLEGFASRFLITGVPVPENIPVRAADDVLFHSASQRWELQDWTLTAGGSEQSLTSLSDWRDVPGLEHQQGAAVYTSHFTLQQKGPGAHYILNLGLVQGSALVTLNGQELARASIPPFVLDISQDLREGDNVIEVAVTAPLRNTFVGRALQEDPRYEHMKGFGGQLVAAGLIGPVHIAETVPE